MGRTKVRFEGRPAADGGSVGAGRPAEHGRARRGGSTHVDEAGARGGEHRRGTAAAVWAVAIGPARRAIAGSRFGGAA